MAPPKTGKAPGPSKTGKAAAAAAAHAASRHRASTLEVTAASERRVRELLQVGGGEGWGGREGRFKVVRRA